MVCKHINYHYKVAFGKHGKANKAKEEELGRAAVRSPSWI